MSMFAETITVAKAVEIGKALPKSGDKTDVEYTVEGFVTKLYGSFNTKYGSQSFYMFDEQVNEGKFDFQAYQCTASGPVHIGDKVTVKGFIEKYENNYVTIEIKSGKTEFVAAVEPTVTAYADVLAALQAIKEPNTGKTNMGNLYVQFTAFVTSDYDLNDDGTWTGWLAADADAALGDIQAYRLKATEVAPKGSKVTITGSLAKYKKEGKDGKEDEIILEIVDGAMVVVEKPMAIENTAVSAKAMKVMENGQLFIIRNGVKYNAAGAVVE